MSSETAAKTYAAALFELAAEQKQLDAVYEEVLYLERLLDEHPELRRSMRIFLESPKIERAEKIKFFESTLRGRLSDPTVNFVLLVVRRGRAAFLRDMLREFRTLHDREVGLVRVTATTAVPLSPSLHDELEKTLAQKLSRRIEIENRVDQSILGGLIVRYSGRVADGSLRTALNKIGASMSAIKFGSKYIHEN